MYLLIKQYDEENEDFSYFKDKTEAIMFYHKECKIISFKEAEKSFDENMDNFEKLNWDIDEFGDITTYYIMKIHKEKI